MNEPADAISRVPTPIPVDSDARNVLLFGGSFDPPHWGHFELPFRVQIKLREALGRPVWLVYVPAARSPHKDNAPNASSIDRIDMLNAGLRGTRDTAIWTDEIDRAQTRELTEEPSFWIETLQLARLALPEAAMRFLIGSDQAISFHRWYKARECMDLVEPLVMLRKHVESREWLVDQMAQSGFWTDEELLQWHARVIECRSLRCLRRTHAPNSCARFVMTRCSSKCFTTRSTR